MKKLQSAIIFLFCIIFTGCSSKPLDWNFIQNSSGASSANGSAMSSNSSSDMTSSKNESISVFKDTGTSKTAIGYFYSNIKAIWVSYLELEPILKNKSKDSFISSFKNILNNVTETGLNTVIVQVRPFGDALYPSKLFPPSIVWKENNASTSDFNPLYEMIKLSHEYKLSFHAWVNPLRGATKIQAESIEAKFAIKKFYNDKTDKASVIKNRYYLNPAYSEVRNLIADGVKEIVNNYNVDAIHIDDYFYPTTSNKFDAISYKKYGNSKTLSDFRLNNCNLLVKQMYSSVHSIKNKKYVKFGISPQGNINNNYKSQNADVKKWCSEKGYTDYIMPQIYYGFLNGTSPFKSVADTWSKLLTNNEIILTAGLACHKIDMAVDTYAGSGKKEWAENQNIISRQIEYLNQNKKYKGFALYSYKSIFNSEVAKNELTNIKRLLK